MAAGDRKFKVGRWVESITTSSNLGLETDALCEFFRAMFSGETKENQTNSITINEFDVDIVESFLCYIHTGKFPASCDDPTKFFPIADYYDVKGLRVSLVCAIHSKNLSRKVVWTPCFRT